MQRKLTVILSADVVGYSGLMERDERRGRWINPRGMEPC